MPERRATLALYAAAALGYVVLGVFVPSALLSWPIGAGFLLAVVWGIPVLLRRLR